MSDRHEGREQDMTDHDLLVRLDTNMSNMSKAFDLFVTETRSQRHECNLRFGEIEKAAVELTGRVGSSEESHAALVTALADAVKSFDHKLQTINPVKMLVVIATIIALLNVGVNLAFRFWI